MKESHKNEMSSRATSCRATWGISINSYGVSEMGARADDGCHGVAGGQSNSLRDSTNECCVAPYQPGT